MRSGLNESVGNKPQLRTNLALTLLPRLRIKSHAIEERRTSSLDHSVPLSIDRAGNSLDFSLILHLAFYARNQGLFSLRWFIRVLTTYPVNLSRIRCKLIHSRPLSKSLEMDRQFPPEIIQLVVEASLDPYDLFHLDWPEMKRRYKILTKYSLLNWTWQSASALSLHELVVIYTEEQVASFLNLLDAKGGIVGGIRDLSIRLDAADRSDIARILRSARKAVNVSLDYVMVSIDDLAHLQQVRRLQLYQVKVVGSPASSSLSLPSLRRLELFEASVLPSAAHFLTPSFLPQLRRLELYDVPDSVEPLIPQLEAISFGPTNNHSLSAATSLQLLLLPHEPIPRLGMLSDLPTLPPFVSIDYTRLTIDGWSEQMRSMLAELLATTKTGLRVILLTRTGEDEDDELDDLIKQLRNRGVSVVETFEELDFSSSIILMEEILEEEERAAKKAARKLAKKAGLASG